LLLNPERFDSTGQRCIRSATPRWRFRPPRLPVLPLQRKLWPPASTRLPASAVRMDAME
jgi:hypothetical protein